MVLAAELGGSQLMIDRVIVLLFPATKEMEIQHWLVLAASQTVRAHLGGDPVEF